MIVKRVLVGMAMAKLHQMWLNKLTQVLGDHTPNSDKMVSIFAFDSQKNFLVDLGITKPRQLLTACVVRNAPLITWRPYVKFQHN